MKRGLLVCDDSAALGRILTRRFMSMGIITDCCPCSLSRMHSRLSENEYSGVIVFAFRPDEELFRFMAEARQKGCTVFAGLYTSSAAVYEQFRQAGAISCYSLPCSFSRLCRSVMLRLDVPDGLLPQIAIFLEEAGLPRQLNGFHYLAKAAEICIVSPDRLWGGLCGIYEEIAAEYRTKASLVERSMRNLSSLTVKNGALSRLTEGRLIERPTNTELICAVCDMYTRL